MTAPSMPRSFVRLSATLFVFFALVAQARADWWPLQSAMGDHTGALVRMGAGFGGAYDATEVARTRYSLGGASALWELALGYSVAPRLAVHLTYYGGRAIEPRFEREGTKLTSGEDPELSLNGIGLGTTYYFPANIYLSGSLGLGIVEGMGLASQRRKTLLGMSAAITSGWEWWISRQWGLGIALHVSYYRAKDDDVAGEPAWNGFAAGPMLSATFN